MFRFVCLFAVELYDWLVWLVEGIVGCLLVGFLLYLFINNFIDLLLLLLLLLLLAIRSPLFRSVLPTWRRACWARHHLASPRLALRALAPALVAPPWASACSTPTTLFDQATVRKKEKKRKRKLTSSWKITNTNRKIDINS